MTNAAAVPVAQAPETILAPPQRDAARAVACVIIAAASTPSPRDVAQRMGEIFAGMAVDITGLAEPEAAEYVRSGRPVFLISSTDWACLEMARERSGWLRLHGRLERCGLVLWHVPGGATAELAEDYTGLPVCAMLHCDEHIERFAKWIAAEHRRAIAC